jgi:deferrochelatase/peroxidase EfeB
MTKASDALGDPSGEADGSSKGRGRVSRRGVLAGAALLGIGAGLDRLISGSDDGAGTVPRVGDGVVAFHGDRQAGIATPPPEFLSFAAFDLTAETADDLRALLQAWTVGAARLTEGKSVVGSDAPSRPPSDTGEAVGLGPVRLTITFGFGLSLFVVGGEDRLGLASRRPEPLAPLPSFRGESLVRDHSDGDLCIQACADDPQVAFHAIHVLTNLASGAATLRWTQTGFGRTASTSRSQPTPRNLMGFKDGTNNLRAEESDAMEDYVWVQRGDGPIWLEGGSYLIVRRIKMLFDVWDATSLEGQERVFGREKLSGAPLGGRGEYEPVDLQSESGGEPVIPIDAHIRIASPEDNRGQRILRRGYSFSEPAETGSGQLDAGLFFICFQRDPGQFISIQRRLSESDALNRHTLHTTGALFACPPGVQPGGFIGEGLFA